jgi:hypothetical protein
MENTSWLLLPREWNVMCDINLIFPSFFRVFTPKSHQGAKYSHKISFFAKKLKDLITIRRMIYSQFNSQLWDFSMPKKWTKEFWNELKTSSEWVRVYFQINTSSRYSQQLEISIKHSELKKEIAVNKNKVKVVLKTTCK